MERKGVYVRKATGLTREFATSDVFLYNMFCLALGVVIATTPLYGAFLYPGANTAIVVVFGMILAVFNGLTYALLSAAMPRSGGDYVYISRILHPGLGFMGSFVMTAAFVLGLGSFSASTISFALSVAISTFGTITGNTAASDLGAFVASPDVTFGLGIVVIVSLCLFMLFGPKFTRLFMKVIFIPAIAGTLVTLWVLATNTNADFISTFNTAVAPLTNNPDSYHAIIEDAVSKGYTIPAPSLTAAFLALPLGYYNFVGFQFSTYFGGEVKDPSKSQPIGVVTAMLIAAALQIVTYQLFYNVVGWDFTMAGGWLSSGGFVPIFGGVVPLTNYFAGILAKNVILNVILTVSFVCWFYMLDFTFFMLPVRNFFAWSFNRVMPEKLAAVSDRTRTPWVAILVTTVTSIIVLAVYVYSPFLLAAGLNSILLYAIVFLITGVVAIVFPWKQPELFNASPGIVKKKIGIPLITICGIVNEVLCILLIYSMVTSFPVGPTGPAAIALTVGLFATGLVIYYVARAVRKSQGFDIDLAWKEVPPE